MTIEDTLFKDIRAGNQVDIERALLIVSGCETEEKVSEYKAKIDELEKQFHAHSRHKFAGNKAKDETHLEKLAASLDRFLWQKGDNRYNGNFLLEDVVDAQMSPKAKQVGNCVGLSSLYAALGTRCGLEIAVLYNTEHVMLRLRTGRKTIDIECTDPYGFGINIKQSRHKFHKDLRETGLIALVSSAYSNRGNAKYMLGRFQEAIDDYGKAIEIMPDFAFAYYNRGNAKYGLGRKQDAIDDYDKAIEIMPDFAFAYNNRGIAKKNLGRKQDAIADYDKAIEIMPDFAFAYNNRGIAREKLGDKKGAEKDFKKYRELTGKSQ